MSRYEASAAGFKTLLAISKGLRRPGMKKLFLAFILLNLLVPAAISFAEVENAYQKNMERDLVRGFKNVLSCPAEIPRTIGKYDKGEGRPVVRHFAGFFDGITQMAARGASGVWDFAAAFMPGQQEGFPVTPETLF